MLCRKYVSLGNGVEILTIYIHKRGFLIENQSLTINSFHSIVAKVKHIQDNHIQSRPPYSRLANF